MKQASNSKWLSILTISSIPIALLLIGIVIELISALQPPPPDGVYDVTIEYLVFRGGLIFALPCGVLNIIVGIFALSKDLVKKSVAISGLVIGILGFLIGLIAWVWYSMIINCCGR
jgi:hypothetical protein